MNPRLLTFTVPLLLSLLVFLFYGRQLAYDFTATDTFTLIETSRLESFEDVKKILTRPLMSGSLFSEETLFYRPLSSFSYALDCKVWGLTPFGYHLSNLVIFCVVLIAFYFLVLCLTEGNPKVSLLASLLFLFHPTVLESIPAIARRQDWLMVLFVELSLLAHFQKKQQGLSLLFFLFALFSKELAIYLPPLLWMHSFFADPAPGATLYTRFQEAVKNSRFFFLVLFLYLIWRFHVLNSISGGYSGHGVGISAFLTSACGIIRNFCLYLIHPSFSNGWFTWFVAGLALALSAVLFGLLVRSSGLSEDRKSKNAMLFAWMWIFLPLSVFLATRSLSPRSLLSSLLAYCLLNSLLCQRWFSVSGPGAKKMILKGFLTLLLLPLIPLYCSLPSYLKDSQWEESGVLSRNILEPLGEVAQKELPQGGTIHIKDLPDGFKKNYFPREKIKTVSYLADYSIESWLKLKFPGRVWKVRLESVISISGHPISLSLRSQRLSADAIRVEIGENLPAN